MMAWSFPPVVRLPTQSSSQLRAVSEQRGEALLLFEVGVFCGSATTGRHTNAEMRIVWRMTGVPMGLHTMCVGDWFHVLGGRKVGRVIKLSAWTTSAAWARYAAS